jgi:hypothetical protein
MVEYLRVHCVSVSLLLQTGISTRESPMPQDTRVDPPASRWCHRTTELTFRKSPESPPDRAGQDVPQTSNTI